MIAYILIGAGILACGLFALWFTAPARCPRCGEKHDPARAYSRPDATNCGRCGCRYNPTTNLEL